MAPKLSILIPSLACRSSGLRSVVKEIKRQDTHNQTEVRVHITDGDIPTGTVRQYLLTQATGKYVVSIDDDDEIAPNYLEKIFEALEADPDCVGFNVARFVDGQRIGTAIHHIIYNDLTEKGSVLFRPILHINPVRRELALKAGFPDLFWGEDRHYAYRLLPLLKTHQYIDEELYKYKYVTGKYQFERDYLEKQNDKA